MGYELGGFVVAATLVLACGPLFMRRAVVLYGPRLVFAALLLRVVGTLVREVVVFGLYEGFGDVSAYYEDGLLMARRLWAFDLEPLTPAYWFGDAHWWGTPFMEKLSGLAVTLTGPSRLAAALLFSMLTFAGLCLMLAAFARGSGAGVARLYAPWLWLWPSLVYWPSTIGKEAVAIFALGLVTYGFVGSGRQIRWLPFLAGFALAFAIRPHMAVVIAVAALASRWLASWQRFDARRFVEAMLFVVLTAGALAAMSASFDLGDPEVGGARGFIAARAQKTSGGGSAIAQVPLGVLGIPFALANVWLRPFPWEFHNATSLFAALEMVLLWAAIWRHRRGVGVVLREWRRSRLLTFALPLLLAYSVMIGLSFANLGLIARQRTPVFPFLFMVLAVAALARAGAAAPALPNAPEHLVSPRELGGGAPAPRGAGGRGD
ncbi:MAG TPA: hypothetical protein VGV61_18435, partial [Thermoanaerobaculia bacterium]|nr:hypothetical protein [Thermoanaerobaculia bacterium]